MTEREKALAGMLYSPMDPELRALHLRAKKLFHKYNKTKPHQFDVTPKRYDNPGFKYRSILMA